MAVPEKPASRELIVGLTADGKSVVINHPDLQPDAEGCGYIVFSPEQAVNLALLLWNKANVIRGIVCGHCGEALTQGTGWATARFSYCFKHACQEEFYKEAQSMIRLVKPDLADQMAAMTKAKPFMTVDTFNEPPYPGEAYINERTFNEPPRSFTCPKCGAVSYSPNDVTERYCGACHEFFADAAIQ